MGANLCRFFLSFVYNLHSRWIFGYQEGRVIFVTFDNYLLPGTSYSLCQIVLKFKKRKNEYPCTCDQSNDYYILVNYVNCIRFHFDHMVIDSRINTKVHFYFEFCETC